MYFICNVLNKHTRLMHILRCDQMMDMHIYINIFLVYVDSSKAGLPEIRRFHFCITLNKQNWKNKQNVIKPVLWEVEIDRWGV